jgi:Ice-binding-like/Bacterial Ig-like domain
MKTKRLWTTAIAAFLLAAFIGGCKDENMETIGVCPIVVSTNPANLATNVPVNQVITVTFNVAMNPLTITPDAFSLSDPSAGRTTGNAAAMDGTLTYDAANFAMTFTPSEKLKSNTVYTGTVATSVRDVTGNALQVAYTWTFSTAVILTPAVISTNPSNNAIGVSLAQVVSATFSVPMDPLTLSSSTFVVMQGTTSVSGTVSYSGATASFTPAFELMPNTIYTATITNSTKNVAGTSMAANYVWSFSSVTALGPMAVNLNSVARFGIIAGVGVSNDAGPSQINNMDVGIYPGSRSSITGFFVVDGGPGLINNGTFYAADDVGPPGTNAMLNQAQLDLVAAYNQAAGATTPAPNVAPADLGGQTLAPGIWTSASTMLLQNGNLTLDAQGDVNAVWIFQIGAGFTSVGSGPFPSASGGNVILAGGAQAKNIFWQVGSSAIIGDYTSFKGNVLAFSSITMNTGAVAEGRMLARNGSVTMTSTNIINKP